MGLFDFIFGKKKETKNKEINNEDDVVQSLRNSDVDESTIKQYEEMVAYQKSFDVYDKNTIQDDDNLGNAANRKHRAKAEIKNKNYDNAFELYKQQQEYYRSHSKKQKWKKRDTDRLCNSVHEDFANIYRLQNKHKEALINLIYAIASHEERAKGNVKKLSAYINRAKLNTCYIEDIEKYIKTIYLNPIMENIEKKIDRCIKV